MSIEFGITAIVPHHFRLIINFYKSLSRLFSEFAQTPFIRFRLMPFYAVRRGRIPGIYMSWPEAQAQVKGFPNAEHKKFHTRADVGTRSV